MKTCYLIDHTYTVDEETFFSTGGHLLAFNPGPRDAELRVTVYYEAGCAREPDTISFIAPAGQTFDSNYRFWPILKPDVRFAFKVESEESLICQVTAGWNNTKSYFAPDAPTPSPYGVRECARSYTAITRLSTDWYVADGIVIDDPATIWVRESEWAIMLNPGDEDAHVTLRLHYEGELAEHGVVVPARRVLRFYMDDIVRRNVHYGIHFRSDRPIAAQWLRTVNWYDRTELMTFWSVPCMPAPV